MFTEDQLLTEFPLGVQFPLLTGKWLLFNWHSHNEQNHIVLAKSVGAIAATFRRVVFTENPKLFSEAYDAKPVAMYKIEIVSPSKSNRKAYAVWQAENEFRGFKDHVSSMAKRAKTLPAYMERCSQYKTSLSPEDTSSWYEEEHLHCANCHNGFKFDAERLYEEKRAAYRKHDLVYRGKPVRPSIAAVADAGKTVYEVKAGTGSEPLVKVKSRNQFFQPEYIAFFCTAKRIEMPKPILDVAKERDDEVVSWKAKREKENAAEQARREQQAIDEAEEFLK